MSEFSGMDDLLQDFLTESTELLSDVDSKLVELEKRPDDKHLLNDIFRGFHTIKGGAGFLNVEAMVSLCHRTENLFDKLRNGEMTLNPEFMDVILSATATVQDMFVVMQQGRMPLPANAGLLAALDAVLQGQELHTHAAHAPAHAPAAPAPVPVPAPAPTTSSITPAATNGEPQWEALYNALLDTDAAPAAAPAQGTYVPQQEVVINDLPVVPAVSHPAVPVAATKAPSVQQSAVAPVTQETTIRIDTVRLDQVLNLSGEIGLTKNRLTTLRTDIMAGKMDNATLKALDEAISQLDLLVGDLQNAVMKTRMQPIGRLFQKYPRLARDLARQLGKEVDLVLTGEETELDKTMLEDLNDPLVHLVRNAVDHGVETVAERLAAGKSAQAQVELSAVQVGDHIQIEITDDGRGMRPDVIRKKALEKGLIDVETANSLDDKQCLQLIFMPGFSTKDQISSISGRGVGMDVVKTNIQKLNGRIDIQSIVGEGSRFTITLPLTLAILPVLVVRVCDQPFAVPLAMVREIIPIRGDQVQEVSGRATIVVRDEILPVKSLARLLGWQETEVPSFGVLMTSAEHSFILAVDSFVGRDDVVIKPLQNIHPHGVAGATLSGDGSVVLVLDMEDLLQASASSDGAAVRSAHFIEQLAA
ncbi:two-component system chemotaxis sensor kinase CheA [Silvimonas terrae]|uniref:Chemotaxis protein CheA n=1 Tax=Silvimonas terrae TaxID=300266 RepID=A0A840RGR6_9NEIS|nr:chemotaxis protein CheA [Silvimonas terrae]MBB5192809.1 two-component system chemotaxis sensor kinase CheA [Silvimonas terrae]